MSKTILGDCNFCGCKPCVQLNADESGARAVECVCGRRTSWSLLGDEVVAEWNRDFALIDHDQICRDVDKQMDVNRHPAEHIPSFSKCFLPLIVLLASAICSFAQRGTMSFISAASPGAQTPAITSAETVVAGSISMFAPALASVAPFKQTYLTWDNPAGASNRVSWGTVRNYWTNGSVMIFTNRFPITNGSAYKVTALVGDVESVPALWPSNRVAELWLRGNGTNMTQGTNIVRLAKFTNTPPGNMQFWGVANITTGWE